MSEPVKAPSACPFCGDYYIEQRDPNPDAEPDSVEERARWVCSSCGWLA